ncbi:MAG: alpha-amylase [Bacteroidales bacterium]|nr:alpha-amylase [Bacteroidales bacterium]
MERKIKTPEWVYGRTLYEVNTRQFTPGGAFSEFEKHLPRLKDLGVGILWFMPIHPIGIKNRKGTLGSYYSIRDYKGVNPEFGNLNEFKNLVKKTHGLGIKVIIDWVANHTAWDHHWTKDHPDFYSRDKSGGFRPPFPEWEDVIHLNYDNTQLWEEMTEDMSFWVHEADIDGFRCDMAHLVRTPFWNEARRKLDRIKPVFMLAESENHDLLEYAFDAIYNWKLLHAMNELAAGKTGPGELLEKALNELGYLPPGASFLNFTSNHDENSWQGSAIERLHDLLEPLTAFTFMLPGIPLIYSGQEAGNRKRLNFFDKDEISWEAHKMFSVYRELASVKSGNPPLANHEKISVVENDAENGIISFETGNGNNRMLVLINLSEETKSFVIHYNGNMDKLRNVITGETFSISGPSPRFNLNPRSYQILIYTGH